VGFAFPTPMRSSATRRTRWGWPAPWP